MLISDANISLIVVPISSQLWKGISCGTVLFLCFSLADDAKEAVRIGLNGILVSNHGARQLDGVPATVSTGANMPEKSLVFSAFWLVSFL